MPRLSQKNIRILALLTLTLSALLLLALIPLWYRSLTLVDQLSLTNESTYLSLVSHQGSLYVTHQTGYELARTYTPGDPFPTSVTPVQRDPVWPWKLNFESDQPQWMPYFWLSRTTQPKCGWFEVSNVDTALWAVHGSAFAIPIYALQILLLLPITLSLVILHKTRHPKSHCQSCNYNLSGNPSTPTCPECGRTTP